VKISCSRKTCSAFGQVALGNIIRNGHDKNGKQRYKCKLCDTPATPKVKPSPKPHQRKKAIAGHKSLRGRPEMYSEVKKKKTFSLTPTASQKLDKLSAALDLSQSELIEQIAKGLIDFDSLKSFSLDLNQVHPKG
jgi:hypothetical protein